MMQSASVSIRPQQCLERKDTVLIHSTCIDYRKDTCAVKKKSIFPYRAQPTPGSKCCCSTLFHTCYLHEELHRLLRSCYGNFDDSVSVS